jgi:hypothetical protein
MGDELDTSSDCDQRRYRFLGDNLGSLDLLTLDLKRRSVRRLKCALQNHDRLRSERRRARMGPSWDAPTKEDLSQDDGVVMSLIMRCKNECNPSSLSEGA